MRRGRHGSYRNATRSRDQGFQVDAPTAELIRIVQQTRQGISLSLDVYRDEALRLLEQGVSPIVEFYLQGDMGDCYTFLVGKFQKPWSVSALAEVLINHSNSFCLIEAKAARLGKFLSRLAPSHSAGAGENVQSLKVVAAVKEGLSMFPREEPRFMPHVPVLSFGEVAQNYKEKRKEMKKLWESCVEYVRAQEMSGGPSVSTQLPRSVSQPSELLGWRSGGEMSQSLTPSMLRPLASDQLPMQQRTSTLSFNHPQTPSLSGPVTSWQLPLRQYSAPVDSSRVPDPFWTKPPVNPVADQFPLQQHFSTPLGANQHEGRLLSNLPVSDQLPALLPMFANLNFAQSDQSKRNSESVQRQPQPHPLAVLSAAPPQTTSMPQPELRPSPPIQLPAVFPAIQTPSADPLTLAPVQSPEFSYNDPFTTPVPYIPLNNTSKTPPAAALQPNVDADASTLIHDQKSPRAKQSTNSGLVVEPFQVRSEYAFSEDYLSQLKQRQGATWGMF